MNFFGKIKLNATLLSLCGLLWACGPLSGEPPAAPPAPASNQPKPPAPAKAGGGAVPGETGTKSQTSPQLKITSYGPTSTDAGKAFNSQPATGQAAIWIYIENAGDLPVVLVWDKTEVPLVPGPDKLFTTEIPAALYSKVGVYNLYVKVSGSNNKSDPVTFLVN